VLRSLGRSVIQIMLYEIPSFQYLLLWMSCESGIPSVARVFYSTIQIKLDSYEVAHEKCTKLQSLDLYQQLYLSIFRLSRLLGLGIFSSLSYIIHLSRR
jgi:hypothetical protein